jgi:hypothetical protein
MFRMVYDHPEISDDMMYLMTAFPFGSQNSTDADLVHRATLELFLLLPSQERAVELANLYYSSLDV